MSTFMYHPTEAPKGRIFHTDADLAALDVAWVDTPAQFPPVAEAPTPEQPPVDVVKKPRGRPPKMRTT